MTPRQKRNLTIARRRRLEKARAVRAAAWAEMKRLTALSAAGSLIVPVGSFKHRDDVPPDTVVWQ